VTATELRAADASHRDALAKLALEHPYSEYAGYARYGLDFAGRLSAERAAAFLEREGAFGVTATRGGQTVGFAGAEPLPWESAHFGVRMGSVPWLLAADDDGERAGRLSALLGALVASARERGLEHLATRVDVRDLAGVEAAQRAGFRLVDTLVTYLGHASPPRPDWVAEHYPDFESETLSGPDLARVDRAAVEHFAAFMRESYRIDRFHADRRLPAERSHELYVEWFRRIFSGEWASGVQLVRRGGRYVGFCSFRDEPDVERLTGVRVIGRGLAAVLPEGHGGYALLAENICTRCPLGSRFQEFDSQIQNLPVINVWIRRGMPFFRARLTFHRWLDE
jgi:hypothetical protein